jgi:hypothetical protein
MGNSKYSRGTQVKEKARQQKQIDKASKRMLVRQKKSYIKTSPPNANPDIAEPIFAQDIVESTDLPTRPSIKS